MEKATKKQETNPPVQVFDESSAERRLWSAVLVQALQEWRYGTLRARREAEIFIFQSKRDFETVCDSAGMNPISLQEKLSKIRRSIEPQQSRLQSEPA